MNYQESVGYLSGLLRFGIHFGLDRILALAEAFGNPQDKFRVIHVAGTNGKGSTATFIASILNEAGYRVGLYTSPYVYDLKERIQIDRIPISEADFARTISMIRPFAEDIEASGLGSVTEFEAKTMAAYLYFADEKVDFAVLEVGMGGRLDATNIVKPLVGVITSIGLDHTDRLGNTLEKIAAEKSGIVKTGATMVTAVTEPGPWRVICDKCREAGAVLWQVVESSEKPKLSCSADMRVSYKEQDGALSVITPESSYRNLRLGLRGPFQKTNGAMAVAAVLALKRFGLTIHRDSIAAGLAKAYSPGRLEVIHHKPTVVIDGAHNPHAATALALALKREYAYEKMHLVIGMTDGHSIDGVMKILGPMAETVIATKSTWDKAVPFELVAEAAWKYCRKVESVDNVPGAVRRAMQLAGPNDLVLVTGSFYTIGEAPRDYE